MLEGGERERGVLGAMGMGVAWYGRGSGDGNQRRGVSAIGSLSLAAAGGGGEHTSGQDTALKVQGTHIHPWTLPTTTAIWCIGPDSNGTSTALNAIIPI